MQQMIEQQSVKVEELKTFKEIMTYLRVSRSTLLRLMANGTVPAHKVGVRWRFYMSEVQASVNKPVKTAEQGE